MALALLVAAAGREELSAPNAMPCPAGDRSCKRLGGGGRRRHCTHSVVGWAREGHTFFYALP